MYVRMDILNGDGFYRHCIFYRLLPIDLHEFYHYYHFKVLNALSPFTIFTVYCCMKCVECIAALLLCIEYYTCFVRNDEIKMSNQSINYHHCANLSEDIELMKCLSDIFCRVCE